MNYQKERCEDGKCLECGRTIYGRPDKKFCDDNCRNRFHSKERSRVNRMRNRVIGSLVNNHNILERLIRAGVTSASIHDLEAIGFKPSCITGHRRGIHRHEEYSCFDILYNQSSSKIYNIRYSDVFVLP